MRAILAILLLAPVAGSFLNALGHPSPKDLILPSSCILNQEQSYLYGTVTPWVYLIVTERDTPGLHKEPLNSQGWQCCLCETFPHSSLPALTYI